MFGEIRYNLILLCVGDLGPNLEQEEGGGENKKGLKRLDSHGHVRGDLNTPAAPRPVRPVGAAEPCTRSHLTAEVLSSKRSLLHDAAILMKIRSAVLEGPRNPSRWPVLRKPPKLHAREDSRRGLLMALDAARRPSPPCLQRGPRRHRRPSPPQVPRPTPVPPRLSVFNRRPPPWFCGANQETRLPSPLAPSIQEWTP